MSLLHRLAARAGHSGTGAASLRPKTIGVPAAPALARMEEEGEAQPLMRMQDEEAQPLRRMEEEEAQPLRRSEEDEAHPLARMEEDEAQPLSRMEEQEAAQPMARTEDEDAQPMMRMEEEEDAAQPLRRMEEDEAQPLARMEEEEAAQPLARTEDEDAQPMMRMEDEDAAQPLRRMEEEEAQPLARMEEDEAQPLFRMEEDEAAPLARMAPPDGDALEAGNSEMPEAMSGLPDDIGAADAMALRRDMAPVSQAFGSDTAQSGGLADVAQDLAGLDAADTGFFDLGAEEPSSDPAAAIPAAVPDRGQVGPNKVQIDQIDVTVLEPTAPAQGGTRDVAQEFSNFARRRFLGGL